MTNQISLKIDFDDIVFKGRNKAYGAYMLRKLYHKHLSMATWIAVVLFVVATTTPVVVREIKAKQEKELLGNKKRVMKISELAPPPSITKQQPIQQQVEAPPPLKATIKFLPPVVKPDAEVTNDYIPTVDELKNIDPGKKTQQGHSGGVDYSLIEYKDNAQTQEVKEVVKEEVQKEEVFSYVEEMPTFPGGEDEVLRYISEKVQYPEIAKRAGVEGRVMVSFVVRPSGSLDDFRVIKSLGAGCDEEAIRVCRSMPRWKPGRQNGKSVAVRVVIPFVFKLQ